MCNQSFSVPKHEKIASQITRLIDRRRFASRAQCVGTMRYIISKLNINMHILAAVHDAKRQIYREICTFIVCIACDPRYPNYTAIKDVIKQRDDFHHFKCENQKRWNHEIKFLFSGAGLYNLSFLLKISYLKYYQRYHNKICSWFIECLVYSVI